MSLFKNENTLTEEQKRISDALAQSKNDNSAFLVNAGAGTGKTYSIKSICIDYILKNPEDKILYLVFNKTMADYFRKMTEHTYVDISFDESRPLSDFVDVKTYHGFFRENGGLEVALLEIGINTKDILNNYSKGQLNKKDIAIVAQYFTNMLVSEKILNAEIADVYSRKIQESIGKYFDSFFKDGYSSRSVTENKLSVAQSGIDIEIFSADWNEEALSDFYKRKPPINSADVLIGCYLNRMLNDAIKDKQIENFHDFYYKRAYENLKSLDAQKRYSYLDMKFSDYSVAIIDEAQDADIMIFNLVKKRLELQADNILFGKKSFHFLAFGDPKQCIYKFKGSFNMFKWAEEPSNKKLFSNYGLTNSFRYGDKVAHFGEMIAKNYFPEDRLRGNKFIKDNIVDEINDNEKLAKYILDNAASLRSAKKERDKMAIIFRTNAGCIDCLDNLRNKVGELLETQEYSSLKETISPEHIVLESKIKKDLKESMTKDFFALIDNVRLIPKIYSAYALDKGINPAQIRNLKLSVKEAIESPNIRALIERDPAFDSYSYLLKPSEIVSRILGRREKGNACVIITNVHQSKGKEYKVVALGDDFLARKNEYYCNEEEINIAHTAVTRARNEIIFYETPEKNNLLHYFYSRDESPAENTKIEMELKKISHYVDNNEAIFKDFDPSVFQDNSQNSYQAQNADNNQPLTEKGQLLDFDFDAIKSNLEKQGYKI